LLPFTEPSVPQISGIQGDLGGSLTYGISGPINSTDPGLSVGILGGKTRVGLQVINSYIRMAGTYDIGYILCAVCEGEVSEVVVDGSADNIYLTDKLQLSKTKGKWEAKVGTASQTLISWFQSLHQITPVNEDMRVPVKILLHVSPVEHTGSSNFACSAVAASGWNTNDAAHAGYKTNIGAIPTTGSTATGAHMWSLYFDGNSSGYYAGGLNPYYYPLRQMDWGFDMHVFPNSSWSTATYYPFLKWQNEEDDTGWSFGLLTGSVSTICSFQVRVNGSESAFNEKILAESTAFGIVTGTTSDGTSADFTHVAISRFGGQFFFFKDGVEQENIIEQSAIAAARAILKIISD
jgi:hypothetical protein